MTVEKPSPNSLKTIRLNLTMQVRYAQLSQISRTELKESKKIEPKKLKSKDRYKFKINFENNNKTKDKKFNYKIRTRKMMRR